MKHTSQRSIHLLLYLPFLVVLLAACAPAATAMPTATARPTRTASPTQPTRTPTFTHTPEPTSTPTRTPYPPSLGGTPLAPGNEAITADNFSDLQMVALWGKGFAVDAAYTLDGQHIVIGSNSGLAIYDRTNLNAEPIWYAFPNPIEYQNITFDVDGQMIVLQGEDGDYYVRFADGMFVPQPDGIVLDPPAQAAFELRSKDGTMRFLPGEWYGDDVISDREIYDIETGNFLYHLTDDLAIYSSGPVTPDGCDYVGEQFAGYDASLPNPDSLIASSDNRYFAIPYTFTSNEYEHLLHIYRASNGESILEIHRAKAFDFSPAAPEAVIVDGNGLVQIWNLQNNEAVYFSFDFNRHVYAAEISGNGKYLVIDWGRIEILDAQDGSFIDQYQAVAYALSGDGERIALATRLGDVRVIDIGTGEELAAFHAHDGNVNTLAFSPDGNQIITAGMDCKVKAWNAWTGDYLHPFEVVSDTMDVDGEPVTTRLLFVSLNPVEQNNQLIGLGTWGIAASWDLNSGALSYYIDNSYLGAPSMRIDPQNNYLYHVDALKGQIIVRGSAYDLLTGEKLNGPQEVTYGEYILSLDDEWQITTEYNGNTEQNMVVLRKAGSERDVSTIEVHAGFISCGNPIVISPDHTRLYVFNEWGQIMVFEVIQ